MSGIFGLIDPQQAPVEPDLSRMAQAMEHWGPDGCRVRISGGHAGLGHARLIATPEDQAPVMPHLDRESGAIFTGRARLDNREALCDALDIPPVERPTLPDSMVLFGAWQRWADQALPRCRGDWAFACWNPSTGCLSLARDAYGQTALYYGPAGGRFAFASSHEALLALVDLPRDLDELRIAQVLTSWPGDGTATIYRAIRRLPPAHALTWKAGTIRIRRYWAMEAVAPIHLGSDDDYVEAFLDLYAQAVRCRLRSVRPVGATLSAGLDSGSVTALAARELSSRGGSVTAFTSVPIHPPDGATERRIGNEWALAHEVALRWPNIDHQAIEARHVTPLAGIDHQVRIHPEPGHAGGNYYWIVAILDAAREMDLGVLLTGQMGNGGISWAGHDRIVWDLLRRGRAASAWHRLRAWKEHQRVSWMLSVRRQILSPLRAAAVGTLYPLRRRLRPVWMSYSAIHPAFARRIRLRQLMDEAGHDPTFGRYPSPRAARLALLLPASDTAGATWQELGTAWGLEVRDPTRDSALVEFCLGIPDEQHLDRGTHRWLIRRGMRGLLPEEVRCNTKLGLQAADLHHRFRADLSACQERLELMGRSPSCREYLDLGRMREVARELSRTATPEGMRRIVHELARGLSVGSYLLGIEGRKPSERTKETVKKGLRLAE